jgi:hypothetical protein
MLFESDTQRERRSPDIPYVPGARIEACPHRRKIPVDRYACFHRSLDEHPFICNPQELAVFDQEYLHFFSLANLVLMCAAKGLATLAHKAVTWACCVQP